MTDPRQALALVNAEKDRRRWARDPVAFCTEVFGDLLWSRQREVLEAVRDHRKVAVPSCHGAGKTFLASRAVCWWVCSHPPGSARVVTTATTWHQVEAALWHEIRRAHVQGKLPGRTNRTNWLLPIAGDVKANGEEVVAEGHRPASDDPTAFQGIHNTYVLVVLDEAAGVPPALWESGDSLTSNEFSHELAIGNPTDPTGEFFEVCKPGSGWKVIPISAFDTPNFTGEPVSDEMRGKLVSRVWQEEKLRKWGEDNPMYKARVLGKFPEFAEDTLIPVGWIRAAQQRKLEKTFPPILGVDVGGGGDKNVFAAAWGPVVRVLKEDRQPDTMKTAGNIKRMMREIGADEANVDYIGIGRGAVDRLKEQNVKARGVQVSEASDAPDEFHNLRAEAYWHLRTLFQNEGIDIDENDEDLAAQLAGIKYETTSNGRIIIESKDSLRRRGKPSPDKADAVMLACIKRRAPKYTKATFGRSSAQGIAKRHVSPSALRTQPVVPRVDRLRRG